jgi:hypothetical protein
MLARIFPEQFDNAYRGHWLGLLLFVLINFGKAGQGIRSIFSTQEIATGPDGISLAGLTPGGIDVVLSNFAIIGLYSLVLPFISAIVLIRYRAMIPFMYLMLTLLYLSNRALHLLHPSFAASESGPQPFGFTVNLIVFVLTLVGFALALAKRPDRADPSAARA